MDSHTIFLELGVALVAGLVIGFEREQAMARENKTRRSLGGARTYPLFSLVGAVAALLSQSLGVWVFVIAFVGTLLLVGLSYAKDLEENDRGLTSEAALLFSFLLGALAVTPAVEDSGRRVLVVLSLSVVASLLLSVKAPLHRFIQQLAPEDIYATLKFLVVAVVVLPLLPDRTYGPLDVLNPRKIGLMVVLIAGISFSGYLAIRLLGARRGLGVTGLLGGLASSTAVTLTFSGRARQTPALADSCALAVVLASGIMFVRVLVAVGVVHPALLSDLWLPMAVMAVAGGGAALVLWRRAKKAAHMQPEQVDFKNPFELGSALKFAAIFAVVLLLSKAATTWFGTGATYLTAVLAGATDVDAITLSLAGLARGELTPSVAVTGILLASASNTLVKGGMAVVVGGWSFGRRVVIAFGVMIALGGLTLIVERMA
ncbi:MAG: MgtC/SapB family protein [Myxococcota bacterium]|nr:MgtC/SapB family protein [Myxococcota bacterium]